MHRERLAPADTDWRARKVRDWLFLLLRFAITRDQPDKTAALAMAEVIDALGLQERSSGAGFFLRTSAEFCKAVCAPDSPERRTLLKRHVAWIEDDRLKAAFRNAVGLDPLLRTAGKFRNKVPLRSGLWRGPTRFY